MALAKHHEEILEKVLENLSSLQTDSQLKSFIQNLNVGRRSRLEGYADSGGDSLHNGSDDSVTTDLIRSLHGKNTKLHARIDELERKISRLEHGRLEMKSAYLREFKRLKTLVAGRINKRKRPGGPPKV